MPVWDAALSRYLATRRALGRAYVMDERILIDLQAFLARSGWTDLDREAFEAWRAQICHLRPATRICREYAAYRFCRYRRRTDARIFVPDPASLTRLGSRPIPTIIDHAQVARMLAFVDQLRPFGQHLLRAQIRRIAIVLLYTTGMRRGELARLTMGDVDDTRSVLHIRGSKFHKSRFVPLSGSAAAELKRYLSARRRVGHSSAKGAPLLCRSRGQPYPPVVLSAIIKKVFRDAGICSETGHVPHAHDFRHSFAVGALLRWYDAGVDVQTHLPRLAMYMGHVSIVSTAFYLRHMPAVVDRASQRFGQAFEHVLGGAS